LRKASKLKVFWKTGPGKRNDIQKGKTDHGISARRKRSSIGDRERAVHLEMRKIQYRYAFL
jgi:hypothetical protein